MIVGVLAVQGDVSEHYESALKAIKKYGIEGRVEYVRRKDDVEKLTHLIIPGGESTTISRLMVKYGVFDMVRKKALDGELAIMGTCAGSILLARRIIDDTKVKNLALMDMDIRRNAFGRQRESFEADVNIEGIGKYHAVFIRAPIIERCYGECKPLGKIESGIVMARQARFLALVFHPELTDDLRIYRLFFEL